MIKIKLSISLLFIVCITLKVCESKSVYSNAVTTHLNTTLQNLKEGKIKPKPRKIALTFDDAPFPSTKFFNTADRTAAILKQLKKAKCPPVGIFVVGEHIQHLGSNQIKLYDEAGHIICNHSYSHPALKKTTSEKYVADIKLADSLINHYKGFRKFFRFPYVDYGTPDKETYVKTELKNMGYSDGYATILTQDWYINSLLLGKKSALSFSSFKHEYIQMIIECAAFADYLSKRHDICCPVQILLLHENDLNAFCISDIIAALRKQGWEIVSIEEAYQENKDHFEANKTTIGNVELARFFLENKSALMNIKMLNEKFLVIN